MNYSKLIQELKKSKLAKEFKMQNIKFSKWMPICRSRINNLPKKVYIEKYYKNIKTWGKTITKCCLRLKFEDKILASNWRFRFIPHKFKIFNGWLHCGIPKKCTCLVTKIPNTQKFNSILLPKRLVFSLRDITAVGLLKGEMISSTAGKSRHYISFTNSDPILVKMVLIFLRKLGLTRENLSFQVIANVANGVHLAPSEYIRHWSKSINMNKELFVKPYFNKRYRTNFKYGSISLKHYSTLFRLFLQFIVDDLIETANISKAKYFLKGILAAEGSIHIAPSNSLNFVAIGVSKEKDVTQYVKALQKVGIKAGGIIRSVSNDEAILRGWKKGTGGFMIIQGWNNFQIIYEKKLLEISPNKLIRFLYGLKNHREAKKSQIFSNICNDLKAQIAKFKTSYEIFLNRRSKLTQRDKKVLSILKNMQNVDRTLLSQELNVSASSASRRLNSLKVKKKVINFRKDRKVYWKIN